MCVFSQVVHQHLYHPSYPINTRGMKKEKNDARRSPLPPRMPKSQFSDSWRERERYPRYPSKFNQHPIALDTGGGCNETTWKQWLLCTKWGSAKTACPNRLFEASWDQKNGGNQRDCLELWQFGHDNVRNLRVNVLVCFLNFSNDWHTYFQSDLAVADEVSWKFRVS